MIKGQLIHCTRTVKKGMDFIKHFVQCLFIAGVCLGGLINNCFTAARDNFNTRTDDSAKLNNPQNSVHKKDISSPNHSIHMKDIASSHHSVLWKEIPSFNRSVHKKDIASPSHSVQKRDTAPRHQAAHKKYLGPKDHKRIVYSSIVNCRTFKRESIPYVLIGSICVCRVTSRGPGLTAQWVNENNGSIIKEDGNAVGLVLTFKYTEENISIVCRGKRGKSIGPGILLPKIAFGPTLVYVQLDGVKRSKNIIYGCTTVVDFTCRIPKSSASPAPKVTGFVTSGVYILQQDEGIFEQTTTDYLFTFQIGFEHNEFLRKLTVGCKASLVFIPGNEAKTEIDIEVKDQSRCGEMKKIESSTEIDFTVTWPLGRVTSTTADPEKRVGNSGDGDASSLWMAVGLTFGCMLLLAAACFMLGYCVGLKKQRKEKPQPIMLKQSPCYEDLPKCEPVQEAYVGIQDEGSNPKPARLYEEGHYVLPYDDRPGAPKGKRPKDSTAQKDSQRELENNSTNRQDLIKNPKGIKGNNSTPDGYSDLEGYSLCTMNTYDSVLNDSLYSKPNC